MNKSIINLLLFGAFIMSAQAGVLDPNCTPQKAAKSAATKATVGVGGRCDMKEAAKDTAGVDGKKGKLSDAVPGKKVDDKPAKKATHAVLGH